MILKNFLRSVDELLAELVQVLGALIGLRKFRYREFVSKMENHSEGPRLVGSELAPDRGRIFLKLLFACFERGWIHGDPVPGAILTRADVGVGYLFAFDEEMQLALEIKSSTVPIGILRPTRLPMKTAGLKISLPDR